MKDPLRCRHFDLRLNNLPTDPVAAKVVYKPGFSEKFKNNSSEKLSTTPLPVRDITKGMEDFTGQKKGYLTVIGLYGGPEVGRRAFGRNRSKPQGHGWVCKCACGNYTVRKTRSLRKAGHDACVECMNLRYLRDIKGKKRS